jgi:hypothetical protein
LSVAKAAYLAMDVNMRGHKERWGCGINQIEGANFFLRAVVGRETRGVQDISVLPGVDDRLKGFPGAIAQDDSPKRMLGLRTAAFGLRTGLPNVSLAAGPNGASWPD